VSPSVLERVRVARSRQTPWDVVAALADDPSCLVRLMVALNFWTPRDLVRLALRDWVRRVRGAEEGAVVSHAAGYDAEGRWWGTDHGSDHEHRSVGSLRSWCLTCGEWCYPDAPCVRCAAATPRARRG